MSGSNLTRPDDQNWQSRLKRSAEAALKEAVKRGYKGCTQCGHGKVSASIFFMEGGPSQPVWNREGSHTIPVAAFQCKKCGFTTLWDPVILVGGDRLDWLLNDSESVKPEDRTVEGDA